MLSLAVSLKRHQPAVTTDSERALVARFCAGDAAAFDCIFRQNQDYVYRLCVGMLADEEWAHDTTQEVFLRAYRSLNKFRGDASLRTWLYRIAINECLQQLRKSRREEPMDDALMQEWQGRAVCGLAGTPASTTMLEDALAQRALMDDVRAALRQLSPSHRAALTLRYFEEMSYDEIAEAMNSSPQRVRALLHRAREAFRQAYLKNESMNQ